MVRSYEKASILSKGDTRTVQGIYPLQPMGNPKENSSSHLDNLIKMSLSESSLDTFTLILHTLYSPGIEVQSSIQQMRN